MQKLLASVVCFALAAWMGVAQGQDKTAPKLEGRWIATGGFLDGEKITEEKAAEAKLVVTFKDGKYNVIVKDKEVEAGTYKIDASKDPVLIDMLISQGNDKDKTQLGILKVEGDKLTIAMSSAGSKDRPKNFEAAKDLEVTFLKRSN